MILCDEKKSFFLSMQSFQIVQIIILVRQNIKYKTIGI